MLPPVSGSASSGAGSSISTGSGSTPTHFSILTEQQIGLVYHAEEVGFILLALLVHGLVVVNDNVKGVSARRLHRNKLLVGVLVIEQIAGYKVALLRKALARFDGGLRLRGLGFLGHSGISIVSALAAVRVGIGRDAKSA